MTVNELIERLNNLTEKQKNMKVLCPVSDYNEEITLITYGGNSDGDEYIILDF